MKNALPIVLLLSFLMVNLGKSLILIHYEINKEEITKKYCINKDKPQMHCCGKCMLKRKLAEQEAQQNSPAFPDIKNDIQLYCSIPDVLISRESMEVSLVFSTHSPLSLFEGRALFHPPCC